MNKQGNTYTLIYTAVMVIVVAFILAFAAIGLKPAQQKNIAIDKMSQILNSVNIVSTPENAQELYGKYIDDSFVVDANGQLVKGESFSMNIADQLKLPESQRTLPIFICTDDSGSPKYIIPLSGAGLWAPSGESFRSRTAAIPSTVPTSLPRTKLPVWEPESRNRRSRNRSQANTSSSTVPSFPSPWRKPGRNPQTGPPTSMPYRVEPSRAKGYRACCKVAWNPMPNF